MRFVWTKTPRILARRVPLSNRRQEGLPDAFNAAGLIVPELSMTRWCVKDGSEERSDESTRHVPLPGMRALH